MAVVGNNSTSNTMRIGIGFGTAGLGDNTFSIVTSALQSGFRKFDTAEESDYWYNQKDVGKALRHYFLDSPQRSCYEENIWISTKIPPWELTSISNIRLRAAHSRDQLVGFCSHQQNDEQDNEQDEQDKEDDDDEEEEEEELSRAFPLDVYFIHAPECWRGWHTRCQSQQNTLSLREAWLGMEAVVGIDGSARRIGLSNIDPMELMDILTFVQQRTNRGESYPPPRIPDAIQIHADPLQPALELRRLSMEYGIEFVSYSTLGTQHLMRHGRTNPVLDHPHVIQLARRYSRSTAEVVLSWAIQNGMSVIPRSNNPQHIQELSNLLKDDIDNEPGFLDPHGLAMINDMSLN